VRARAARLAGRAHEAAISCRRPPIQITVADVIQAIEGPVTVTACTTGRGAVRAVSRNATVARSALSRGATKILSALGEVHDRGKLAAEFPRRRRPPRPAVSSYTLVNYGRQTSDLHGLSRDGHRAIRASSTRCCRTSRSTSATPASRNHPFGWEGGGSGWRRRASRWRISSAPTRRRSCSPAGATESDNLAIKGVAEMYREKGNHIITAVTEHKAIIDTCKHLEKDGYRVTYLAGAEGRPHQPRRAEGGGSADKTILITIMAANNEIGVPPADCGDRARSRRRRGSSSTPTRCRSSARCRSNVNEARRATWRR